MLWPWPVLCSRLANTRSPCSPGAQPSSKPCLRHATAAAAAAAGAARIAGPVTASTPARGAPSAWPAAVGVLLNGDHTCAGGRWWKVVKGIAHESPTEPSGKVYDGAVRCKYYGAGRAHVCACTYGAKKQQPCFDSLLRARLSTHGNCENAKRCGARQNPDPSHSSRTSFALAGLPGVGRSFELLFATFDVVQYLILVAAVVPGLGVQAACAHERWSLVLHACEQSPCHSLRSSTH